MPAVTIVPADVDAILPLIADYQRFYGQVPDDDRNRAFFGALPSGVQFAAMDGARAVGFVTLYFLPSSLTAASYCLLNDLYTLSEYRGQGVGRALIEHCRDYALEKGYPAIEWMTQRENVTAQRLYDSLPAERTDWAYYALPTRRG
ncbi:MAG: GCN5-related N-acetyltransferase [Cyanobacteria bacterium RYN_339]|nr:GCN5-related N-acetyltransferase [Cyanobacteria bacterium RYN_339]